MNSWPGRGATGRRGGARLGRAARPRAVRVDALLLSLLHRARVPAPHRGAAGRRPARRTRVRLDPAPVRRHGHGADGARHAAPRRRAPDRHAAGRPPGGATSRLVQRVGPAETLRATPRPSRRASTRSWPACRTPSWPTTQARRSLSRATLYQRALPGRAGSPLVRRWAARCGGPRGGTGHRLELSATSARLVRAIDDLDAQRPARTRSARVRPAPLRLPRAGLAALGRPAFRWPCPSWPTLWPPTRSGSRVWGWTPAAARTELRSSTLSRCLEERGALRLAEAPSGGRTPRARGGALRHRPRRRARAAGPRGWCTTSARRGAARHERRSGATAGAATRGTTPGAAWSSTPGVLRRGRRGRTERAATPGIAADVTGSPGWPWSVAPKVWR